MNTKLLKQSEINVAAELLKKGEVVAFPTETVFGLGVIFDNENAYHKLVEAKQRPPKQPFTLMLAFVREIEQYIDVDYKTKKIIEKFMPGPLTIIAPIKRKMSHDITLGTNYIGIRVSNLFFVSNLISLVGKPLLVPSANVHGEPPCISSSEVIKVFDNKISAVIDGVSLSQIPSTIIKVNGKIELIREGAIPFKEILKTSEGSI
ncbi:MAG: L-threonylcarbamoyladenylate synthase [Bacillota bacterium]|jgi:L-threonylcarbamoyladenylate synthase|nr:L-threonylcarbamoyladenylate synthase [Bacillota bacterium]